MPIRRLAAVLLLVSACAQASTAPGQPTATSAATSGPAVPAILDFEAPLLDGGTFRGADLAGKDVAFWFWAPW